MTAALKLRSLTDWAFRVTNWVRISLVIGNLLAVVEGFIDIALSRILLIIGLLKTEVL